MLLELQDIQKSFGSGAARVPVLRGVNLSLEAGQTLALTGESGSGKSTLMHITAGLDVPDAGAVRFAGQDLVPLDDRARAAYRQTEIALVFQQFNLIPSLTVAANISFQAALSGRVDPPFIERLTGALGLTGQMEKYPEVLSGGQQQRVAIARALAAKPRLLLADEPTGNLDESTAIAVLDEMLSLVAQTGAALMVVTHSPAIAARMDRVLHLSGGRLT
ncbi:ABC transporter ATP-binding protein [Roseovarius faecimaris]|uniref:ABC transporter ATP-binding protein n=1 Tax=Roseovarius faecimaris TaxID=2494550 RepID=A0A6I6ISJ3_9RHOB|nr:ABC transporter ATP-binding protein [Roseovarius faecimaris]QGX99675.1 ABC transporter ATP-binding protein [Roseovarius faecimaris]